MKIIENLAKGLQVKPKELEDILIKTVFPSGVKKEEFLSFLIVADKYNLNPLLKEIYAFPSKGGIQPIVSIDGWLKIINTHPEFNGMEVKEQFVNNNLFSTTCKIFKKNVEQPIEITEYLEECYRETPVWRKWPARMLRHKAVIQAARYAFGLSGIIDPDEAERIKEIEGEIENPNQNVTPKIEKQVEYCSQEKFNKNKNAWKGIVESGQRSADELIAILNTKTKLTDAMVNEIKSWETVEIEGEVA
ncbi:recombinase RecT [Galenea microaerophila]